jgi:hypothetical protein
MRKLDSRLAKIPGDKVTNLFEILDVSSLVAHHMGDVAAPD